MKPTFPPNYPLNLRLGQDKSDIRRALAREARNNENRADVVVRVLRRGLGIADAETDPIMDDRDAVLAGGAQ